MKKYIILTFGLFSFLLLAACAVQNSKETKETTDKKISITVAPTPDLRYTAKNFTEGIWIKKYPENYACFKFETPEEYQIICDPYDINEELQPDIVTESHQHEDHNDTSGLTQPYQLITGPGEYKIDVGTIRGFAGQHNKLDKDDTNDIYIYQINDITIAHFASQGELPSDKVLKEIGPVDVLLIQIFTNPSYPKLTLEEADKIISKLKPKIVIPEHGDYNACYQLSKCLKVTEEVEASGSIVITRDTLDHMDGIRVINLDN